ncbi:MAG: diguanylate cyclase [Deltaproteobacteria bacterium]|nr:diguanylate cyclase [Deltaproteobacteria bacterium]
MDSSYDMAKKLLPFLARRRIPLIPENYHLFYDYLLGTNPELTRQLNETLQQESLFTTEISRRLYRLFYDVDSEKFKAIARVGEQIGNLSQTIEENLGQSLDSTGRFQQVLSDSAMQMGQGELEGAELKEIVDGLLQETTSALSSQTALAELIEASNKVIASLTAELKNKTRQANIDELTQLFNRRFMTNRFLELISSEQAKSLAVAIFDLDRFKSINDTWGHSIGDKVLIITSKIIQNFAPEPHTACRYGGEEFVILFVGLDLDEAYDIAENIRRKVQETEITIRGTNLPVTISAGVSLYMPGDDEKSFISRADKALYQAKAAGRNMVKIYRPDSDAEAK